MLSKNLAFTIIELIMAIVIIATIAGSTSAILLFFMRNTIFLPSQMNAQQAADVAMDMIIEGDNRAKGLRFATGITSIRRSRDLVSFTNSGGRNILYRIRRGRLYRRIDGGRWEIIPYYATGDLRVTRQPGGLFEFFDEDESTTSNPDDVRRIRINLLARTGTGDFDELEGEVRLASSVKLYRFAVNQTPEIRTLRARYFDRWRFGIITFWVDDPDGGDVDWSAMVTGDPRGNST